MVLCFFCLLIVLVNLFLMSTNAVRESLNFALEPSKRACFFEDIPMNELREVEVFVYSGGLLDISLFIYGPLSLDEMREEKFERYILEERIDAERQTNSDTQTFKRTFKPEMEGTYAFCLDNRHAKFVTKLVEVLVFKVL